MKYLSSALLVISVLIIVSALSIKFVQYLDHRPQYVSESTSQFGIDSASELKQIGNSNETGKKIVLSSDGTIKYLNENFQGYYGVNQTLVAPFTNNTGISTVGATASDSTSNNNIDGGSSVAVPINKNAQNQVVVSYKLPEVTNLSRWSNKGFATMWLNIQNRIGISGVSLRLTDSAGNYRTYSPLMNAQVNSTPQQHNAKSNTDPFPDIEYPGPGILPGYSHLWQDFWLNAGWNYLPWRADGGYYADHGPVNMSNIKSVSVIFTTTSQLQPQTIQLNDLRMVDGLQGADNEVAGNWYPPLMQPQYGVYDVNQSGSQASLKILNVRNTQYLTNGDHGRLLSNGGTPLNFAMRTQFSVNDLSSNKTNTYVRFLYDFDPSYDPGHDWFGTYMSLQYGRIGLLTVKPVVRYTVQTQEPANTKTLTAYRQNFEPKENQRYELDVTVHGQNDVTTLYEVDGSRLKKLTTLEYTFKRPREKQRNPIGFEVTGNAKETLYNVELVQL